MCNESYPGLAYGQAELARIMRETYDDLITFVTTPQFQALGEEIDELEPTQRPAFVRDVLLDDTELAKRGINRPEGILIQRSAFGDRRPTLFCVKKYLPKKYHSLWENVNLTFDSKLDDREVSRDGHLAWRDPLPVRLQARLMEKGISLEDAESSTV